MCIYIVYKFTRILYTIYIRVVHSYKENRKSDVRISGKFLLYSLIVRSITYYLIRTTSVDHLNSTIFSVSNMRVYSG